MKFNLEAAKAYMGALVATSAGSIAYFLIGLFEAATSIDLPASIEGLIVTGITAAIGYIGVYFTPNKPAAV